MKKFKDFVFNLIVAIFWIPLSLAVIYGYYFIIIPIFWNHGSSYAFEAAIILSIIGLWGSFYILAFCYLLIDNLRTSVKNFRPANITQ